MSAEQKPNIVIVEDNPLDVYILQDALKLAGFTNEPLVLNDGEVALAMLKNESPFESQAPPDLMILDLNLQRVDGPEVLKFIRQTERLRKMKVVILSSSPTDLMRTKAVNADGYFTKPSVLDEFMELGAKIRDCYYGAI
jgi:CheY-like chemotaxis protein